MEKRPSGANRDNNDSAWIEISLGEILKIILSKALFIIVAGILAAALTFGYTAMFVTPLYRSSTTMYVFTNPESPNKGAISNSEIAGAEVLANTFKYAIKESAVLEEIKEDLKKEYSIDISTAKISSMTDVSVVSDTSILKIYVSSPDAELAYRVADTYYRILPSLMKNTFKIGELSPIGKAVKATSPYTPNRVKNSVIGGVIGLFIAALFFVIRAVSDNTIYSEREIETFSSCPIVGDIPEIASIPSAKTETWLVEEAGEVRLNDAR